MLINDALQFNQTLRTLTRYYKYTPMHLQAPSGLRCAMRRREKLPQPSNPTEKPLFTPTARIRAVHSISCTTLPSTLIRPSGSAYVDFLQRENPLSLIFLNSIVRVSNNANGSTC